MKGMVFTSFLDLVEEKFGYEMVDRILLSCDLPSKGVYTSVGTYEHSEMVQLVTALSKETQVPVSDLLKTYGNYFFPILSNGYPQFITEAPSALDLLERIEHHIHVEVIKLYPDAELPRFDTRRIDAQTLELVYHSKRKMADFAEGLILSTFEHYKEQAQIEREDITEDGSVVRFVIRKA
ncbi:MAG: heme NO-binding domain-containing protein [Bacteroidota bacterium]